MVVFLALRQRQVDLSELEASLIYTVRPCLKEKKKKVKEVFVNCSTVAWPYLIEIIYRYLPKDSYWNVHGSGSHDSQDMVQMSTNGEVSLFYLHYDSAVKMNYSSLYPHNARDSRNMVLFVTSSETGP